MKWGLCVRSAQGDGQSAGQFGEKFLVEIVGALVGSARSAPWIRSASASLSLGAVAVSHVLMVHLMVHLLLLQ